jgi:anaerobic ribonucleoside-triphosphate reductase activating protein
MLTGNIHSYISSSFVNGPGNRFVLWFQGCTKGCLGCFNPETWSNKPSSLYTVSSLVNIIRDVNPSGVTISGGDPFEQSEFLLELLKELYSMDLRDGIIVFSGFTIDEINSNNIMRDCLGYLDVLIDGRFEKDCITKDGLRGSSNQNIIYFSSKVKDLLIDQEVEVGFDYITGFPLINSELIKLGIRVK